MPLTAFPVPLPIQPKIIETHPALQFYAIYGQKFPKTKEEWNAMPTSPGWHAKNFRMRQVDGTWVEGDQKGWEWFRKLYASFPEIQREIVSLIVVSNDEDGTHQIHTEIITKLPVDGGKRIVELPQSFTYTVGKSESPNVGILGMQFIELRNYYDLRTLETALQ